MPPSFRVAFSYIASESPHSAAPSTWARMLSGCTWVPTSVATVSFLTLTSPLGATATWATHAVQLAVARSCGERQATPQPLVLGQLLGAVTGRAHRGKHRVAQALRPTGIGALAVEHIDAVLRRVLADRMRDFIHHAFDRPEGPAGCYRPQLTRRGGVVRHLITDGADVVIGHGVEEVRAVHGERIERPFLVDRGRQEIRDAPALGRPGADHVMIERDQSAVAVETGLDLLERQRTREVHGHVVFAGVDDLDRLFPR